MSSKVSIQFLPGADSSVYDLSEFVVVTTKLRTFSPAPCETCGATRPEGTARGVIVHDPHAGEWLLWVFPDGFSQSDISSKGEISACARCQAMLVIRALRFAPTEDVSEADASGLTHTTYALYDVYFTWQATSERMVVTDVVAKDAAEAIMLYHHHVQRARYVGAAERHRASTKGYGETAMRMGPATQAEYDVFVAKSKRQALSRF